MTSLKEESIIQEFKNKYNIAEIIQSRYNDDDITKFYQTYFEEIEKIEKLGGQLWKMFSELWNKEKQELIINILLLLLLIEKQIIYLKKIIFKIQSEKTKKYLITFINNSVEKDKVNIKKYLNDIYQYQYINVKSFDELEDIYHKKRNQLKEHLEKIINQNITEN